MVPLPVGGSTPDFTGEIASLFLSYLFAENCSVVLNKVSTFKVKKYIKCITVLYEILILIANA